MLKRLVLAVALLLGLAAPAHAAWSRVQGAHAALTTGAGTTYSVTMPANITAGNLVLCESTWGTTTQTDLISVKIGTTSAVLINPITDATDNQSGEASYFINAPGATQTITITMNTGVNSADLTMCDEFTNTSVSTATLDGSGKAVPAAGATVQTSSSFGNNGDLAWGGAIGVHSCGGATTLGAGTGFTAAISDNNDPAFFGCSAFTEWQAITAATQVPFTNNNASEIFLVEGLAFTIGGGGPTCPKTLALMGVGC